MFTVDFNEIIEDEVEIKWTISPSSQIYYLPMLNQRQVNFQPGSLLPDTTYLLKTSLIFKSELSEVISTAAFKIKTLPQPEGGTFKVSPTYGIALETKFSFSVTEWNFNRTSKFQFFIKPHGSDQFRVLTEKMTAKQSLLQIITLPAC